MTGVDTEALRERYAQERAKRLRPDGNDQYVELNGQFGHYLEDPYTERVERAARRDHVTMAFIGGGFAGLVTARTAEGSGRSTTSASSRRAAASAAPGTGTAIRARSATPRR